MTASRQVIPGIVKDGVITLLHDVTLPEGTHVEIVVPADGESELMRETELWDRASDEAWRMIDEWERENP